MLLIAGERGLSPMVSTKYALHRADLQGNADTGRCELRLNFRRIMDMIMLLIYRIATTHNNLICVVNSLRLRRLLPPLVLLPVDPALDATILERRSRLSHLLQLLLQDENLGVLLGNCSLLLRR